MASENDRDGPYGQNAGPFDQEPGSPLQEMEAPLNPGLSSIHVNPEAVNKVMYSEIGISVLLNRLKQSIASGREFATFLSKRARLEEKHAQGLKEISKSTQEAVKRPDGRQGTYALGFTDISRAHDRIADHGVHFANSMTQMNNDLTELTSNMDRNRKHWKQEGLNAEKRVKDAESAMDKAKARYDSLAEDYDRARTGDRSSGRVFTVKGPKSAEKHEEDLYRKLQAADSDYATKVQAAQAARQENLQTNRPQAIHALQELIRECDAALTLQLQKFAAFNERLLVADGLEVSPVKDSSGATVSGGRSMRDMILEVDNERDFQTYVTSHSSSVPAPLPEIKYQKHPLLGPTQQVPQQPPPQYQSPPQTKRSSFSPTLSTAQPATLVDPKLPPSVAAGHSPLREQQREQPPQIQPPQNQPSQNQLPQIQPPQIQPPPQLPGSRGPSTPTSAGSGFNYQNNRQGPPPEKGFRGPPPQQHQQPPPATTNGGYSPSEALNGQKLPQHSNSPTVQDGNFASRDISPSNPVFGVSLDELFQRDDLPVPSVVIQCIQAVDLFGLEVEGIYRLSGNQNHISQLRSMFDHDASRIDFRNPENFYHDVNSVAGLLKQFFRDLPDPLFTSEHYSEFIEAGRIDDDVARRDSIHAVINALPDPNYATIRALSLHLHRVQERSTANRMSTHNLAICFAPTVMGQHTGAYMADAGLQARVVDTVLQNTFQIFEED